MHFPGSNSPLNPIISSFLLGIPSVPAYFIYLSPSKLLHLFLCDLIVQKLRLYDVDSSLLRLEAPAPSQAALLDCCFQTESVAFTAASDGSIIRFVVVKTT